MANGKPRVIRIAAALIRHGDLILLVRKRGARSFMQAGGKIEPGETPLAALRRELDEELHLTLPDAPPPFLGRFVAEAVNEPGAVIEADLFEVVVTRAVEPGAEIEEMVWIDPSRPPQVAIAPLSRDHVLPLARARDDRPADA